MLNGLHDLFKIHKKAFLVSGNVFSVDCVLKPYPSHTGFALKGFSTFVGATFDDKGYGYFGDSFELIIDVNDLKEFTNQVPVKGWIVDVKLPQYNNDTVSFCIEQAPIDRTLGMYMLKCTAATEDEDGKRIDRNNAGGI